jgi:hypothetical protein
MMSAPRTRWQRCCIREAACFAAAQRSAAGAQQEAHTVLRHQVGEALERAVADAAAVELQRAAEGAAAAAGQDVQERRLAAARLPQHGRERARREGGAHVAQNLGRAAPRCCGRGAACAGQRGRARVRKSARRTHDDTSRYRTPSARSQRRSAAQAVSASHARAVARGEQQSYALLRRAQARALVSVAALDGAAPAAASTSPSTPSPGRRAAIGTPSSPLPTGISPLRARARRSAAAAGALRVGAAPRRVHVRPVTRRGQLVGLSCNLSRNTRAPPPLDAASSHVQFRLPSPF